MKTLLLLVTLLLTFSAQAKIYKCVDANGRTNYTQTKCPNAQEIIIRSQKIYHQPATSSVNSIAKKASVMASARRVKEIDREINDHRERIVYLQQRMRSEIAQLREKKYYANNNLAGATWEQSISQEIEAVTKRYDIEINVQQKAIDRLYEEQKFLKSDFNNT